MTVQTEKLRHVKSHLLQLTPAKPHCYDAEIQEQALAWFDKHLKKR